MAEISIPTDTPLHAPYGAIHAASGGGLGTRQPMQLAAGVLAYLLTRDLPDAASWRIGKEPEKDAIVLTGHISGPAPISERRGRLQQWADHLGLASEVRWDTHRYDDQAGELRVWGMYCGVHVQMWTGLTGGDMDVLNDAHDAKQAAAVTLAVTE